MGDELLFVQFPHPGREHGPGRDGVKEWNVGAHARKFMKVFGRWRNGHDLARFEQQGNLVFWGEWEPESLAVRQFPGPGTEGPRFLHIPFWVPPPGHRWRQNTDPYVFGARFRYSNCRQNWKHGPLRTQRLAPGSIILFGSTLSGKFVLDTVLVVASAQRMDSTLLPQLPEVDNTFHAVVGEVLYRGRDRNQRHRLYSSATPEDPVHGMFSFFPCLPYPETTTGFPRPEIRLPGLVDPKSWRSARFTSLRSFEEAREVWEQVVEQVRVQGLLLGVYAETPPRFDSVDKALRSIAVSSASREAI